MVPHPILVFTTDQPFGESIRQALQETGRFSVFVTDDVRAAKKYLREQSCSVVFLDPGPAGKEMLAIGRELCRLRPDIRFVVIVEFGETGQLEELLPYAYLSKPFYLPDLLETVDNLFPEKDKAASAPNFHGNAAPASWMTDVALAAQHLTRLTLESSAQAALITRQDTLWAYAGQLSQAAAREIADVIARYWDREEESDLVRFVRLASTNQEHMLYATRLQSDQILALVFDAETPFSTIRAQANQLVRSLASFADAEEEQEADEQPNHSIAEILADVPPPNPRARRETPSSKSANASGKTKVLGEQEREEVDWLLERAGQRSHVAFSRESSPARPLQAAASSAQASPARPDLDDPLGPTVKSSAARSLNTERTPEELAETRPSLPAEATQPDSLEPVSPSVFNLKYACLLIPRFAHHRLVGDLARNLAKWVEEICIAFGWRLESISVRPDYLQWVVSVPPVASPGYLMRIMRQHTSERIFADFPRLARENPSGDFWAPGYLIMGGAQPPPPHLIQNFIAQTRHRQGISQQLRS